jgi:hypothetical protein
MLALFVNIAIYLEDELPAASALLPVWSPRPGSVFAGNSARSSRSTSSACSQPTACTMMTLAMPPGRPPRPATMYIVNLADELQRIYDSEINIRISWLWDGGIDVWIGDDLNGYVAQDNGAAS